MTQAAGAPLLQIDRLYKAFDGVVALNDVSMQVPPGGVFGIVGPNGAGKTTLFNVISGLYAVTSGTVSLDGRALTGRQQHEIAALGVARTFQNLQVFGHMTVLENVLIGCHRHGRRGVLAALFRLPASRAEERQLLDRARAALDLVGVDGIAHSLASDLPPGRQRTVEIARALALEPKLLLLDEPAAGLTTRETEALADLIQRIAATGLTTMLIEHDMTLVREVCGHVAVLDQGRMLAAGSPSQIQGDPRVIAAYLGDDGDDRRALGEGDDP